MIKITIPIEGMHCRSCEITIGQQLERVARVRSATVSLKTKTATIEAISPPSQDDLRRAVQSAGYEIGASKKPWLSKNPSDYKDFTLGIIIIGVLAILYSQTGLDKLFSAGSISSGGAGVALLTGVVAGLSTCMALVGGLVLGLSARHAKKHPSATALQKFRPHLFFNASRIVSFFILGGLIGLMGASFQLQGPSLGLITILVGIVMFSMGLQLTSLFPRLSNGGLTLPSSIAKVVGLKKHSEKEYSHRGAVTLGAISFFLPCGFTQVMQLYAISTGSFTAGALVMGLFALGTTPGLLGVGGLTSIVKGRLAGRFFRLAGVAVMAMALVNISNGYNLAGFQLPSFNSSSSSNTVAVAETSDAVLKTTYTLKNDIIPSAFTVTRGQTYTMEVDSRDNGEGCMSTIMIPGLFNTPLLLEKGKKQVMKFTADRPGTYQITCAMGVPRGTLRIV